MSQVKLLFCKKSPLPGHYSGSEMYWGIRFSSFDKDAFIQVKESIKAYGRPLVSWHPELWDKGAWIITTTVLQKVSLFFYNFDDVIDDDVRDALEDIVEVKFQASGDIPVRHVPCYAMLGLSLDHIATKDEIKSAYRGKSRLFHPDTGGAHQLMVALNYAYEQVK